MSAEVLTHAQVNKYGISPSQTVLAQCLLNALLIDTLAAIRFKMLQMKLVRDLLIL